MRTIDQQLNTIYEALQHLDSLWEHTAQEAESYVSLEEEAFRLGLRQSEAQGEKMEESNMEYQA